MKKLFVFSSSLAVVLLIGFACKKSSTTTPPATTSTSSTTGTTTAPSNTTTTNFTVDGTAASNPTSSGNANFGPYTVSAFDNSGAPSIQITFPGTVAPASGSYVITIANNPTAGHCNFLLTTGAGNSSSATTGTVTVVGLDAYFTNIVCSAGTAGTHTVTGNIKY